MKKNDCRRVYGQHRWLLGGVSLLVALLLGVSAAGAQTPPEEPGPVPAISAPQPPLRIATRLMRPDAFEENGQMVGFSVDLARAVVEQIGGGQLQRPIEIETYPGVPEILAAIRSGAADLGVGTIALTSQREGEFDFSHPILSAGLQIMVPAAVQQTRQPMQEILSRMLQPDLLRLSSIVLLLMLIPAHVLWYFERSNQEGVIESSAYIPGIFQALWWTFLALLGQAEDMPNGPVGKLVAVFWVFVGIIYVTYFTAGLTAELAVQEIQGNIQSLSDLQHRPIALVADEGGIEYLDAQNVRQITRFTQPEAAYAALKAQQVEAMVAPRPLLLYFADYEPDLQFQLVGAPFFDQFYGVVMPEGSPYRTPINRAILTLRETGAYGKIYRQWFGVDP